MAEASSPSVGKSEQEKDLTDLDMAAAAQHLMQLSGEEDEKEDTNNDKNKKSDSENHQKQSEEVTSSAKIRTTQQEASFLPKRQRRYRSIVHIYMATKPVNAIHRKQIRS
ncbi:hypothetical protein CsSME_00002315 [Camellia sinensis var. sinensis]|uniref:Uncharacterized protein n=1 Tax=Camellia sinensis TaxID=4442 RepID=A0A7J7I5T0_CAMSI|nr:hypothetical protein HYC85_001589 [Camellia sinensis]